MISGQQIGKWEIEVEYLQGLLKESIVEREKLSEENRELRRVLNLVISMAGNPDSAKGCRIIITTCKSTLDKFN